MEVKDVYGEDCKIFGSWTSVSAGVVGTSVKLVYSFWIRFVDDGNDYNASGSLTSVVTSVAST